MSIKEIPSKVKKHIERNAVRYTVAATTIAVAAVALQQWNVRVFDEFLEEQGIDKRDYYTPDWRDEKN